MRFTFMTAFLLLMVSCSTEEGAKSWYVSADGGSDNNPGTLKRPFQTLAKAAESAGAGDICYIREGTYREVLRPKQSGNAGMPVTFTSYENEQVIISCMETLSGWEKDAGEVYRCAVPWNLGQDNMVMADGRVCTLARWPDEVDGDPFTLNSLRNTKPFGTLWSIPNCPMRLKKKSRMIFWICFSVPKGKERKQGMWLLILPLWPKILSMRI